MHRLIFLLLFFPAATYAHAQDYKCTINRLSVAGDEDDKFTTHSKKIYIGKEFTVERRTGVMSGSLKNSFLTAPEVVDFGSTENSFKVVATMRREQGIGEGSNVFSLVINEFVAEPRKPFIFLENDRVYLGTCLHF